MSPPPLVKASTSPRAIAPYLARRPAAVTALVLGALALLVVIISQPQVWASPDARLSVGGLVVTALAAGVSVARRERASALWLVGLGCAGASIVLGYLMMLVLVVAATLVLIAILHSVL